MAARWLCPVLCLLSGLVCSLPAAAHSVVLTGVMGGKALLIIDGGPPKALAVNDSHAGVRLLSVQGEQATVEYAGQRHTLRLGAAPVSIQAVPPPGPSTGTRKVVLRADSRGHFLGSGLINHKPMQYMVDTGASTVALGLPDAQRLGLPYQNAPRVALRTANGSTLGWQLRLGSVRVGDISLYGVTAVVIPQALPHVLLGNSFLSQLHMTRQGNELVLEQR